MIKHGIGIGIKHDRDRAGHPKNQVNVFKKFFGWPGYFKPAFLWLHSKTFWPHDVCDIVRPLIVSSHQTAMTLPIMSQTVTHVTPLYLPQSISGIEKAGSVTVRNFNAANKQQIIKQLFIHSFLSDSSQQ